MIPLRWFAISSWILLPSVMYGGYALLTLLRKNKLTSEQVTLFRAGHAHAGVLLVMSLLYNMFMATTTISAGAQVGASAAVLAGILLQSGGFFWQAFVDKPGAATGARVTSAGAALLAAATAVLVYGLVKRHFQ